ncbi:hypothetical protein J8F10_13310 [Gemmata sp. G18]|uniref:DUF3592 domain-containing protein n=1 Tax=Gemmata palustris TaxID=2822762 RepID=A0ABS5BS71_9BACT|nr:hypothetical protein [Gemmata palustris]MBP3956262.1 hypothetical protein [Gemmata palustris]
MDHADETWKFKCILVCGALFLISCFMCYDELAFQISGKQTAATVTKAYPSSTRRGGTETTVEYAWSEPGGAPRKAMFTTDPSWVAPADGKLQIVYTPGADGSSRLLGQVRWGWIAIFVGSLGAAGAFMFLMWRESRDDGRPRKRVRTR